MASKYTTDGLTNGGKKELFEDIGFRYLQIVSSRNKAYIPRLIYLLSVSGI